MQLNARTETFGVDDQRWLGSAHATNNAHTITVDAGKLASFKAGGVIPSGTPVKAGDTGKYEPVTDAGDTLAGFLLTSQPFTTEGDVVAPMRDHGRIRVDRLPKGGFDVTNLTTKLDRFVFVEDKEA